MPDEITSATTSLQTTDLQDRAVFSKFVSLCAEYLAGNIRMPEVEGDEPVNLEAAIQRFNAEYARIKNIQNEYEVKAKREIKKIKTTESGKRSAYSTPRFAWF